MKVEEALEDPDWTNAMDEEVHKFSGIKCGHWLKSPKMIKTSLAQNECSGTSKMRMEK